MADKHDELIEKALDVASWVENDDIITADEIITALRNLAEATENVLQEHKQLIIMVGKKHVV